MACSNSLPKFGCCDDCTRSWTVDRYENTTTVPDWHPPAGTIVPYTRPIPPEACGGVNAIPCAPWGTDWPGNSYTLNGTITFTVPTVGFKAVQAKKSWHGRWGFESGECDTPATADTTKYRRVSMVGTFEYWTFDELAVPPAWIKDYWGTCTREYLVGQFTGVITIEACAVTYDHRPGLFDPPLSESEIENEKLNIIANLQNQMIEVANLTCGNLKDTEWNWDDGEHDTGSWVYSNTVGTREFWFQESEFKSVVVTLSEPYTAEDCYDDGVGLLSSWNLSDHAQYPWRTDESCTISPLVIYDEFPTGRVFDFTTGMISCDWTDSAIHTGDISGEPLAAGYGPVFNELHRVQRFDSPIWTDIGEGDFTPAFLPQNATQWTDSRDASKVWRPGAMVELNVVGTIYLQKWAELKVPRVAHNYFRPCGHDRWLIDETDVGCIQSIVAGMVTLSNTMDSVATGDPVIVTNGDANDGCWQVNKTDASHYTLVTKLADLPSWWSYESGTMGRARFWGVAWPICGRVAITNATNATPIEITTASATELQTGDWVTISDVGGNTAANGDWEITRVDSTHFTLDSSVGNADYISGGWVKTFGAPDHVWDTDTARGDYIFSSCTFAGRPNTTTNLCATGNVDPAACIPGIYVTPNNDADTASGGVLHRFVEPGWDQTYGCRWQGYVRQFVDDPYWQAAHEPCDWTAPPAWTKDTEGNCGGNYAYQPLVEARCEVIPGSPWLPEGYTLDCMTPTCSCPSTVGISDGAVVECETAWGLWLRQQTCVDGDGAFAADYFANGVTPS
jgi:hypothetical protein